MVFINNLHFFSAIYSIPIIPWPAINHFKVFESIYGKRYVTLVISYNLNIKPVLGNFNILEFQGATRPLFLYFRALRALYPFISGRYAPFILALAEGYSYSLTMPCMAVLFTSPVIPLTLLIPPKTLKY